MDASGDTSMYQVYALKYAERDIAACNFFFREASHDPVTLHYYVWLILGGPHPVLVDTGFLDDDASHRGIRNWVSPAAMVERVGVKAADIPIALITHLHYDHWAGHTVFPSAEFWIQREEVAFWAGPPGAPRGRPHRRAPDRQRRHGARPRRARLGRLAFLPEHRAAAAGADHHEPAGDVRRLRDDRRTGRDRTPGGGRARSPGRRPVQASRARRHPDRVNETGRSRERSRPMSF